MDNRLGENRTLQLVKRILCTIAIIMLFFVVAIPFFMSIGFAIKDYKPFMGYGKSEFIGFENFERFFNYKYAGRMISNSAINGALTLVMSTLYVFLGVWAVASFKNPVLKGVSAFVLMLPLAISPVTAADIIKNAFGSFCPLIQGFDVVDAETNVFAKRVVIYTLYPALQLGAFFIIGGLFSKEKPLGAAIKFALLCFAVSLIQIFTSNFDFALLVQSPSNYQISEVMDTYAYVQGLQSSSFSYGSTVEVIKILLQFIPTVLATVMLIFVFKNKPDMEKKMRGIPAVGISVLPLVLLTAALLFGVFGYSMGFGRILGGCSMMHRPLYISATFNSILYSLSFALIAVVIILMFGYAVSNAKTVGLIVACAMILIASGNMISGFMLEKYSGIMNSGFSVILGMFKIVPTVIIICAMIHNRRGGLRVGLGGGTAVFAMMFVYGWGNLKSALLPLNDEIRYPLSIVERQVQLQAILDEFEMPDGVAMWTDQISSDVFILVPVIVLAVFIIGAAFVDWAVERKKNNKEAVAASEQA